MLMNLNKNKDKKECKSDGIVKTYLQMVEKQDIQLLLIYQEGQGKSDYKQGFLIKNKNSNNGLLQIMNQIMQNDFKEEINSESKVDIILGIYLLCLSQYFNDRFYRIACILFQNIRNCLNKYGYNIIEEEKKISESIKSANNINNNTNFNNNQQLLFTQIECIQYIPLIFDYFLLYFLPENQPFFDQNFAIYLIMDFSNWLYKKQLTKLKSIIFQTRLKQKNDLEFFSIQDSSQKIQFKQK
ncbi:hypothetical protein IMG5_172400 [Ichthyophthirius multifiliis]|uniref:Uncharacterized protein n=1 Tax=Ichthyophthirius multifiliis TaxID=5932 RepID=G0R1R6_ICHMU|nr:hypothetical protein IMG5_172400 [Ichthyophthirius multifiliis]EGR28568.1 hypothetical protein IMG5_172400 [Ichthyophthirius multifiliis]|eukprot:XP_004029804.1 hypothetical protein IMG5_172400 [Ichthyophthirius multifiliis]